MIISTKYKFISLDPQKTGTNYRQNLLIRGDKDSKRHPTNQHANLSGVRDCFDINSEDYFKFTFVRNPWERYLSWFRWQRSVHAPDLPITPESFQTWVINQIGRLNDLSFWYLEHDEMAVDFIGMLENMSGDMKYILSKVGLKLKVPNKPINSSGNRLHLNDFYNQETIDLVANKEANVINLKGYSI